jgi:uracil-DNA glycosylase family 4
MINIKGSSFSDCSSCDLLGEKSCILESNCEYFDQVQVIFIAENPGKDEVDTERPLIGKSGQVFRKYFRSNKLENLKYILTNVVLCQTLDEERKNTINPEDEVVERCKENCFKIIEQCKNIKLIVLMGMTPAKAFQILPKDAHITSFRGKMFKWRDHDIFLTVHPSFVMRNRAYEEKFDLDMKQVAAFFGISQTVSIPDKLVRPDVKGVHYYRVDDKFYDRSFKLLDIQFLPKASQILYIFKDKDNKKVYQKENDDYYCYKLPSGVVGQKVMKYEDLFQVKIPYREKQILDPESTYDGDFKLVTKHANDYYLQKKEEDDFELNIMFLDMEIYSEIKEFPDAKNAREPICMITYSYKDKMVTYALDNKILLKDKDSKDIEASSEVLVFKSEKDLISSFIRDLRALDPDVITGWNVEWFDLPYLAGRCDKLGINKNLLSKFGEVDIDAEKGYAEIYGFVITDQLSLYKTFSPTRKENYRLGTIAQIELKETKIDVGASFSDKFRKNVNGAIGYNRHDTRLCKMLEDKVKHVVLLNQLKTICKCTFQSAQNAMGQLDSLVSSWLKSEGYASRNANVLQKDEAFEGAYVKEPSAGLHEWVVDFDFTSLYPSLILTFNIGFNTFVMKLKDYTQGYDFIYQPEKLPEKVSVIIDPVLAATEMEVPRDDLVRKVKDSNLICTINGCFFKPHDKEVSFYSEVLDYLLKSRKVVKDKMFEAKQAKNKFGEELYNVRQLVFKVLANAMYGVLGNAAYRFFNTDCARAITLSGQEFLKSSIIYADSFTNSFRAQKYIEPAKLSKQEVFGELDRKTSYVITGDTDSIFLTFEDLLDKKLSEEEKANNVRENSDYIQQFLNKQIVEKMVADHNVNLVNNRLVLKNELVIKRGIFLKKKRYAIYVISQEGTKTDEIVSMGLDTKRSDYPSFTKDCLKELLDLILKSEKFSLSQVKKFIDSKEAEFIQKARDGDKTIAKPVSFTKDIEDYKKIPQNINSMTNWNDLEYHAFSHGSKGYLFKVSGLNNEVAPKEILDRFDKEFLSKNKKLQVICVPDEEVSLPKYYNIDVKDMVKFAWGDRTKLLLEPLIGKNTVILGF